MSSIDVDVSYMTLDDLKIAYQNVLMCEEQPCICTTSNISANASKLVDFDIVNYLQGLLTFGIDDKFDSFTHQVDTYVFGLYPVDYDYDEQSLSQARPQVPGQLQATRILVLLHVADELMWAIRLLKFKSRLFPIQEINNHNNYNNTNEEHDLLMHMYLHILRLLMYATRLYYTYFKPPIGDVTDLNTYECTYNNKDIHTDEKKSRTQFELSYEM